MTLAQQLEGLLWPERFPPGDDRHDPDHLYWDGRGDDPEPIVGCYDDEPYQWSADTIEWVAEAVTNELINEARKEESR